MHGTSAAIAIVLALPTATVQGQLVIVTESTKQYHRPACPILRDGKTKDIIAMNVGQAELRGFKPHPDCHSAEASSAQLASDGTRSDRLRALVFVYTAAGDKRYHRENCARLAKERRKVSLEEAGKKLWPCSVCRPPIRQRTPAIPRR